jgi:hypothetical protein
MYVGLLSVVQSIRHDFLNKYAEDMLMYCTTLANDEMHEKLDYAAFLLQEKRYQILQLQS